MKKPIELDKEWVNENFYSNENSLPTNRPYIYKTENQIRRHTKIKSGSRSLSSIRRSIEFPKQLSLIDNLKDFEVQPYGLENHYYGNSSSS